MFLGFRNGTAGTQNPVDFSAALKPELPENLLIVFSQSSGARFAETLVTPWT